MTQLTGAILGAALAGSSSQTTDPFFNNGRVARIARDLWTGDAAQNDTVVLAYLDWTTRLDSLSVIEFTDAGTGVNLDVGFEIAVGSVADALIDGQDISAAAGSTTLLKSVAIGNRHKPLWELAGFASNAAAKAASVVNSGKAKIIATFMDANPDAMTLSWAIYGSPQ